MKKHDVISDAITAIPDWLAFLQVKEDEQLAILAEIQQQETEVNQVEKPEAAVDPLSWLDDDDPPPMGEPQAPVAISHELPAAEEDDDDDEPSPPWSE
jgi:hypothetical protein